jgi:uncharacterized protein (TIGR02145 family)
MAENLNHGNFIPANNPQRDNFVVEKYCSNDQETSCTQFGAIYQWDELMDYQVVEGGKGICPPGWHLPAEAEWQTMLNAQSTGIAPPADGVAGGFLKDTVAFNGFHAKLIGISYSNNFWAFYTGNLTGTMFWTSALYSATHAWARGLNTKNPSVSRYAARRGDAFSVRCIRD